MDRARYENCSDVTVAARQDRLQRSRAQVLTQLHHLRHRRYQYELRNSPLITTNCY
jgi:DNA invertase Pin-like site-specific DNA recombinase